MEETIILPGSVRSKKNSKSIIFLGRGKNRPIIVPSSAYRKWEKIARKAAKAQWTHGLLANNCSVKVAVKAYYAGRRPDLSGVLESIGDCLEGIVWENDTQIISWDGSRLYHDKSNPRTEVTIIWGGGESR